MKHKKHLLSVLCTALMLLTAAGCGGNGGQQGSAQGDGSLGGTTIYVDIAASLSASFGEITARYREIQPNVTVSINSGSSGQLMREIEEAQGHGVDLFFSAGQTQVRQLEDGGLVVDGSTVPLLRNNLCLVTGKESGTSVTGWETIGQAKNMALCDGSVPVGRYSRIAFVALGYLPASEEAEAYTADEISAALGGIEINECANVSAAAQAVSEGSNEIGTVYYSDYYDFADTLTVLAQDDGSLTGDIIYPLCRIANPEADEAQTAAAEDFYRFLQTDEVAAIFAEHCFGVGNDDGRR